MRNKDERENTGAWVVHHGRKLALDSNGAAEFPAIDEAAKAAGLLARLGETKEVTLPISEVKAIAVAGGLNPRHELNGLLTVLEKKRLIDQSEDEIAVLGVTTRGALGHAADLFNDAEPSNYERAAITLGDAVSLEPRRRKEIGETLGDEHSLSGSEVNDFLGRAEEIGFIDAEGEGSDRLLFNGNLFRRDTVNKTSKVLDSLSTGEQAKVSEVRELLQKRGCVRVEEVEKILETQLFDKLRAAGLYDLNVVGNESGEHVYVTSPSAFHKFVNPMVDDSFDMAKALVAALSYGINARSYSTGRIYAPEVLIGKLISGGEVGPATAIGQDYRVLELARVVKLSPDSRYSNRFYMKLLKKEIGELALQVLTTGDTSAQSLNILPAAPMSAYKGPETARSDFRRKQSKPSKRRTLDVLEAVRGGREFR